MALKTPYCTVVEADVYLELIDAWLDLDEAVKDEHLLNARYYIDTNYVCTDPTDGTTPDEYKYANARLAYSDSVNSLYSVSDNGDMALTYKQTKAGSVTTTKKYGGDSQRTHVDRYPLITAILDAYCKYSGNKTSTISNAYLVRN